MRSRISRSGPLLARQKNRSRRVASYLTSTSTSYHRAVCSAASARHTPTIGGPSPPPPPIRRGSGAHPRSPANGGSVPWTWRVLRTRRPRKLIQSGCARGGRIESGGQARPVSRKRHPRTFGMAAPFFPQVTEKFAPNLSMLYVLRRSLSFFSGYFWLSGTTSRFWNSLIWVA